MDSFYNVIRQSDAPSRSFAIRKFVQIVGLSNDNKDYLIQLHLVAKREKRAYIL